MYPEASFKSPLSAPAASKPQGRLPRERFEVPKNEWWAPLFFLLCFALLGLSFYPALLVIFFILMNRWRNDRYDFIIMLTLLFGEYGFTSKTQTFFFFSDIALALSAVLWFVYRKPPLLKKMLFLLLIYVASIFILATFSIESMTIQFLSIRPYLAIFYIIVPIAAFSGQEFEMDKFFRKIIVYSLIICAFYIIDAFVLSGNVLVPNTTTWDNRISYFYKPLWHPFSMMIYRKYPPGLYILMLAIYPLAKYYKLTIWQWLLIIVALISTLTFTMIAGFALAYFILTIKPKTLFSYMLFAIVAAVSLYYVDGMLPPRRDEYGVESRLRYKSTIDQVLDLRKVVDDEDLAKFASGRMAQIIPKFELVAKEKKQATGLGFLHREKSKINAYIIINDYYTDISQNEEVATGVEVIPAQIYIHMGYIGLIIHTLIFILLYLLVRPYPYSPYVLVVMLFNVWLGLGGFAGLISPHGLFLTSLSISAVVLESKKRIWGLRHDNGRLLI